VAGVKWLHLIEDGGRAGAVVVDAWPLGDAVEVCAGHDDVVRVAVRPFGDQIVGSAVLGDFGEVEVTSTGPAATSARSSLPMLSEVPPTGMLTAPGVPRVPFTSRSGWAVSLLLTTTPRAPAACAFWAFSRKVHAPRGIRAIVPAGKPAKSPPHNLVLRRPREVQSVALLRRLRARRRSRS